VLSVFYYMNELVLLKHLHFLYGFIDVAQNPRIISMGHQLVCLS
jgi:hypothetical protein